MRKNCKKGKKKKGGKEGGRSFQFCIVFISKDKCDNEISIFFKYVFYLGKNKCCGFNEVFILRIFL